MKEKECEHQNLMEMKVMETRKSDMIVIRLRECGTCGARVKTLERMSGTVARERVNSEVRLGVAERKMIMAETELMIVIDALESIRKVMKERDDEKRESGQETGQGGRERDGGSQTPATDIGSDAGGRGCPGNRCMEVMYRLTARLKDVHRGLDLTGVTI
ncbi:hypothetical protein ES705_42234 [subsurface metagenome]